MLEPGDNRHYGQSHAYEYTQSASRSRAATGSRPTSPPWAGATSARSGRSTAPPTRPRAGSALSATGPPRCATVCGSWAVSSPASPQAAMPVNLGAGALQRSTFRRKISREDLDDMPHEFRRWVWAGGRRLKGLIRRRKAEVALYAGGRRDEAGNRLTSENVASEVPCRTTATGLGPTSEHARAASRRGPRQRRWPARGARPRG